MDQQIMTVSLITSLSIGTFALAGVLSFVAWTYNRTLVVRLAQSVSPHVQPPDFSDLDVRFERILVRTAFGRSLHRDLGQLSARFRPGRLIAYGAIASGAAFVLGAARLGSTFAGAMAAVATMVVLYMIVRWRAGLRWNDYRQQLPEALHVISSALSAGASLNQALKHSAREIMPPLQGELQRVVEDVEIGKTLEEALTELQARVPLAEFDMVIASLLIQQRSGGNLGELLNETAHLIKQNEELRQEMQVLTSQATASARLISLLPVLLFIYLLATNRSYLDPMLNTNLGNTMLAVGTIMDVAGYLVAIRISTYSEFEE